MPRTATSRRDLALASIIALAAAVRTLALWDDADSLLYRVGGLDAPQYLDMARRFTTGQWPDDKPFFWAPGYSFFLGLLRTLGAGITGLKLAHVLLGALSCALVARLAARSFDDARVTLSAAAIAALYGPLVYYDLQISPASLDVFCWLLTLVLLLEARQRERPAWWLAAGIAAAASAATRGAVLLLVPLVVVWVLRTSSESKPRGLGSLALFIAPIALVVALIAHHNVEGDRAWGGKASPARQAGGSEALFLSYNLGINFLLGNVAEQHAINRVEHPQCLLNYKMLVFQPVLDAPTKPSAQSRALMDQALSWMRAHPWQWLQLLGVKALELVHGEEISRDTSIEASGLENRVLAALIWKHGIAFPSGLVIPLALLGLAFAGKRAKEHALVLSALAVQATFVLAFFVTTRYRLALWTSAIPYAAYALVAAWDRVLERRPAALGLGALALGAIAISNTALTPMPTTHAAFEHVHLGALLDEAGDHQGAAKQWRTALAIDPRSAQAHFQLASYETGRNDLAAASAHYAAGLQTAPATFAARLAYASLLIRQGRTADAREQLRRVIREVPSPRVRASACFTARYAELDLRPDC